MNRTIASRRRPAVSISMSRASRLHRLATLLLGGEGRTRAGILADLGIGLRTFYRELELLRRCGLKVRRRDLTYAMAGTLAAAEGRLPFPNPSLSFTEAAELARGVGPASARLAALLAEVVSRPIGPRRRPRSPKPTDRPDAAKRTPAR